MQVSSPLGPLICEALNLNDQSRDVLIFSHEFGVNRFGRDQMLLKVGNGLLAKRKNVGAIWFNYANVGLNGNLCPTLSEQAVMLDSAYTFVRKLAPNANITFIGHSLGSMIASKLLESKPERTFARAVLLAPPAKSVYFTLLSRFQQREGTVINHDGISCLQRTDGSTTLVTAQFWAELLGLLPYKQVGILANNCNYGVLIIRAALDNVLGMDSAPYQKLVDEIGGVDLVSINTDHDFRDQIDSVIESIASFMGW